MPCVEDCQLELAYVDKNDNVVGYEADGYKPKKGDHLCIMIS